jgi:mannosyltransferase OCH1-like enzyme
MPLDAPDRTGPVDLAVDVVEEGVRWYGSPTAQRAQILPPIPATDRREHGTRSTDPGAPQIPRVLHMIWLGGRPLPASARACLQSWRREHPEWEIRLWTDEDAPRPPAVARARNLSEAADIIRYAIIRDHGGVYVDTDVECLRPIDELLTGVRAFAAYEVPGRLCNAVIGAIPGHPAFALASDLVEVTAGTGQYPEATATLFLTRVLEPFPDVTLFGPERFYPYLWDEELPRGVTFPNAYAVHHWAKTWLAADA